MGGGKRFFCKAGPATLRLIENALVGPIIAIASFVCSVGNIPLASHLWSNGISFGGVISFIYADLLVVPLLIIYAKYYGTRAAIYLTAIFYCHLGRGWCGGRSHLSSVRNIPNRSAPA